METAYNPVIDVVYEKVIDFDHPDILVCKRELDSNDYYIVTRNGVEVFGPTRCLDTLVAKSNNYLSYKDDYMNSHLLRLTHHNDGSMAINEFMESDILSLDRVYNKSLIFWDSKAECVRVANKNGKILNDTGYLNIIWHKKAKELLGVHFISFSNNGMNIMRLFDVMDETGVIKESNIKVSKRSLE